MSGSLQLQEATNASAEQPDLQFKASVRPEVIRELRLKHHNLLASRRWAFNYREYEQAQINRILQAAEQIPLESLSLHECRSASILKQIHSVSLPDLKLLYLNHNNIANLQGLARAKIPNLERLYLNSNDITSLRPLRKCCFKLKTLDISNNKALTIDDLWSHLDLSKLQVFSGHRNKKAIFTLSVAKSRLNYPRLKEFNYSQEPGLGSRKIEMLLTSLGVHKVNNLKNFM